MLSFSIEDHIFFETSSKRKSSSKHSHMSFNRIKPVRSGAEELDRSRKLVVFALGVMLDKEV